MFFPILSCSRAEPGWEQVTPGWLPAPPSQYSQGSWGHSTLGFSLGIFQGQPRSRALGLGLLATLWWFLSALSWTLLPLGCTTRNSNSPSPRRRHQPSAGSVGSWHPGYGDPKNLGNDPASGHQPPQSLPGGVELSWALCGGEDPNLGRFTSVLS